MTMNSFEQKLQAKIEALPETRTPEKPLWKGIERVITAEEVAMSEATAKEPTKLHWVAMAASVVLVSVLWVFVPSVLEPQAGKLEGYALVESLSRQQSEQITGLLASYESSEAVTQNWQQQLAELEDAAQAIKLVLKEDPSNPALLQMLQQVYNQQIALIEQVHAPKWQQI